MKRSRGSSDSLSAFLPICHTATDKQINPTTTAATGFLYAGAGDYSPMFEDEEIDIGDGNTSSMKKRRLSVEQVKALEKNFEIDNKLEPERKVKLAQELGLQPRQVAIWFQNRRARWKTKQLERDFGVLKSNFDALKRSRDSLQHDNDSLLKEIKELRAKLNVEEIVTTEENGVLNAVEAVAVTNSEVIANEILELSHSHHQPPPPPPTIIPTEAPTELNFDIFNIFPRAESFGENSTDSSDSSAVLNEEYSPTAVEAVAAAATAVEMSTIGCFGQFVKMEEHGDLFSGEEACKLFADNEQFYCSGQWTA